MKNKLRSVDKGSLYEFYLSVITPAVEYDKITKYDMVCALKDYFINFQDQITKALSLFSLNELKNNHESFYVMPVQIVFFYDVNEEGELYIIEPFADFVNNLEIDDEIIEFDIFKRAIEGMVEVYGAIRFTDIERLYAKIRDEKYRNLPLPEIDSLQYFKTELSVNGYKVYLDAIVHPWFNDDRTMNNLFTINKVYSLDFYLNFQFYGNPEVLFDKYIEKSDRGYIMWRRVWREMQSLLQLDPDAVMRIHQLYIGVEDNLESLLLEYPNVVYDWPLWDLGGQSFLAHIESNVTKTIDVELQEGFLLFLDELILYANKKFRFVRDVKTVEALHNTISSEDAYEILNSALKRKNFIQQFIMSKVYTEDDNTDEFISALLNSKFIERGYAYQFEDDALCIYSDHKVYHVKGITQGIDVYFEPRDLPLMVDLAIFPLHNCLTYGITMSSFNIGIGNNMKATFKDEIISAKHIRQLSDLMLLS